MSICKVNELECCECQPVCGSRKEVDATEETVSLNYEAECKRLTEILHVKEQEWIDKNKSLVEDLLRYEHENEILKAKLSVVELIFRK